MSSHPSLGARAVWFTLLCIVILACGCSTQYTPLPRQQVSMIVVRGKPAYVREGRVYPHGFVGDGLVEAVQGNARAVEEAEKYRDSLVGSFISGGLGATCAIGTIVVGTMAVVDDHDGSSETNEDHQKRNVALGALAGCMLAGLIVSSVLVGSAPTHHYDAINIYNDSVDEPCAPPLANCSPGLPPAPSAAPLRR